MSRARRPVRVLVAEDSATSRELLVSVLSSDPDIDVVGSAANGVEAVQRIRELRPSLAVMDIHMPVMDGFEATRRIMAEVPTPIVIVTAGFDPADVALSLRAVSLGALTILPKPPGPNGRGAGAAAQRLVSTVKALADVKVVRRRWWPTSPAEDPPPAVAAAPKLVGSRTRIVAVAASTGGPAALQRLLSRLPGDLGAPFVVVQHIADGFAPGLVAWLNGSAAVAVKLAEHGELLVNGQVYVAPDGRHLEVTAQRTVQLSATAPVGGFRPSATVLFRSVARAFGRGAVAVVLTGMGNDGLAGIEDVRSLDGRVLVQDETTSVVFGMPGVVARAGLADLVAPVERLAAELAHLTARRVS